LLPSCAEKNALHFFLSATGGKSRAIIPSSRLP
jgi:hypothetical protein